MQLTSLLTSTPLSDLPYAVHMFMQMSLDHYTAPSYEMYLSGRLQTPFMDDGHSGNFTSKSGVDFTKLTDFGLNTSVSVNAGVYTEEGIMDMTYGPFGVVGNASQGQRSRVRRWAGPN